MTLSTFRPASKNVNRHTARGLKALQDSMRSVGYTEPMVAAADGEMLSGSARLESVADVFGLEVEPVVVHTTGNQPIIHVRDDIPNAHTKAAQKIALGANRIHQLDFDIDVQVLTSFDADVLDGLWTGDELSNLGQQWADEQAEPDGQGSDLTRYDVPDALFASDNPWGVPTLDANLQAQNVDLPAITWGSRADARKLKNPGLWHFYTEDYRFTALWDDPSPVVNSGCKAIVEPNLSCFTDMPPAVALFRIYQKRWISRWWQQYGIRVFVDLNVAESHAQINLLGVPSGWRAWATRGYAERMDATEREYALACERAGNDDILFLVYGGGKQVRELCQRRNWVHIIEQRDAAKEKEQDG